jgi:chromosome segregation ATPase
VANQAHTRSIEEHRRAIAAQQELVDLKQGAEQDRRQREAALIQVAEQKRIIEKHENRIKLAIGEIEDLNRKLAVLEKELGEERSHRLLKHSEVEKVSHEHARALSELHAIKNELTEVESSKTNLKNAVESEVNVVSDLKAQISQLTKSKEVSYNFHTDNHSFFFF